MRPIPKISNLLARLRGRRATTAPIDLAELLGREPVNLDTPQLQRFLADKRVLVTGAGGSIGSEICRQTARFCPRRLVLVERFENSLFEIDRELRARWLGLDILPRVADICDAPRMAKIFESEQPQVIFHCAAHKHVPMMEANPGEAVKNNVFGTKIVADAAAVCEASAFVMVSTDKAVNPTSVMGATKRVAELYVQSLNARHEGTKALRHEGEEGGRAFPSVPSCLRASVPSPSTRFVAVRFGNVLGSNGSVVPIFRRQIEAGGPVTVTHPEMRRYFMTIPEASQLVMQAGAIGQGGEIFVLDMGQPVRILDLAHEMIRRAGLRVGRDIEVQFTGIRPGEKLYEELSCDNEAIRPTSHEKIQVWQLPTASSRQVERMMSVLSAAAAGGSREEILLALQQSVSEYRPTAGDDATLPATNPRTLKLVPAARAA